MKKKLIALLILSVLVLNVFITVPASAAVTNPYGTTSVGCISNISMKTHTVIQNEVQYFTSSVTSTRYGTSSTSSTFDVYGAVGGENTRMFVYSMGKNNDTDFATKPVKTLMQNFAAENPDWIPVAAINGDFFDIETGNTPGIGEPENVMIQNGDVYKGHHLEGVAGAGVIGMKKDGSVIYHINGFSGTTDFSRTKGRYNLTVMDSTGAVIGQHDRIGSDRAPSSTTPSIITPDSSASVNLTGMTVYVIDCSTYRYAYRGGTGHVDSQGDYTYFVEGVVESKRDGTTNEKPASGKVYIAISPSMSTTLAVGKHVKVNQVVNANWSEVYNAVGFKQAILVNGDCEFVKGSSPNTSLVPDTGYYSHTNDKHRSAIGFKANGTPVILAIPQNGSSATYYEIAEQLKALGCTYGFVLDGGGSTTMIIRNNDGTYSNAFVGENGTTGRSVGNAIILAVPKNGTQTPPDDDPVEDNTTAKPEEPTTEPVDPSLNTLVSIEKGNQYIAHAVTDYTVNGKPSKNFQLDYNDSIGISGWAGFSQSIRNLGYFFDNDTDNIRWNTSFVADADESMKEIGGSKTRAFNFNVDVDLVSEGHHTVSFILKLNDGTFVIVETLAFTSTKTEEESTTETPTTEPDEEPTTEEPTTEEPTTEEPTTEPTTEPVTEPTTEPTTEPVTEPTTEAPTEAPMTDAPDNESPTEAPNNTSPTVDDLDVGGCGSTIGGISAMIVAIGTTCMLYAKKKRK